MSIAFAEDTGGVLPPVLTPVVIPGFDDSVNAGYFLIISSIACSAVTLSVILVLARAITSPKASEETPFDIAVNFSSAAAALSSAASRAFSALPIAAALHGLSGGIP